LVVRFRYFIFSKSRYPILNHQKSSKIHIHNIRRNYAELLWQSGALGQVLYLAAEAAGFGATGLLLEKLLGRVGLTAT
jgi:hypothetical protein